MTEAAKSPKTRRSSKGRRRRETVLDATLMVAAERGLDGTSIGTVAEASATPKSLVLYHFGSRDGLLEAAVQHAIGKVEAVRERGMTIAGGDPKEQLRAWIAALYAEPEVVQAWCLLSQVTARTSPAPGLPHIAAYEKHALAQMTDLLERGNDEFCWQAPSPKKTARTVLAMLDGLRMALLRAGFDADLQRAEAECRRAVLDHLVR